MSTSNKGIVSPYNQNIISSPRLTSTSCPMDETGGTSPPSAGDNQREFSTSQMEIEVTNQDGLVNGDDHSVRNYYFSPKTKNSPHQQQEHHQNPVHFIDQFLPST